MIGICVGILLVGLIPITLPASLPQFTLLILLLSVLVLWRTPLRRRFLIYQYCGLLLGIFAASCWGLNALSTRLSPGVEPVDIEVVGIINSLPAGDEELLRFDLGIQSAKPVDTDYGSRVAKEVSDLEKIRVSWYRPDRQLIPGQVWQLKVRVRPVHGMSNPGAGDYEVRLLAESIDAVGYVRDSNTAKMQEEVISLHRSRYLVKEWLHQMPLSGRSLATLDALLLGDKSGLDDASWQLLIDTGTVHLVVISGLHIGLVCLIGYWLGGLMQRLVLGLFYIHMSDIRFVRVITAIVLAAGYAFLAGFSVPTQRALVMAAALLIPPLLGMQFSLWQRFLLALTLVLLLQPLAFYLPGFWLSFGAVAILISALSQPQHQNGWRNLVRAQWIVCLGLFPLLSLWMGNISISSPLVNMIAVPYVSFLMLPGSVVACFIGLFDSTVSGMLLDLIFKGFWGFLELISSWLPGKVAMPTTDAWKTVIAYCGGLLLVQSRAIYFRWLGAFLFLPVVFSVSDEIESGRFKATVIDVGQGLAVLIETRNHALLYDTGKSYRNGSSVARFTVMPVLRRARLKVLDKVVISHGDNDHAGGFADISDQISIKSVESGSAEWRSQYKSNECISGQQWSWDGIKFTYIQPRAIKELNENNLSCVLLVQSARCSLLIPGDVEASVERQIIRQRPGLSIDWLVASHHGSASSSSAVWLESLSPELVIFSAGANNRYGHPASEVVNRIEGMSVRWRNTADAGAVFLNDTGQRCSDESYRAQKKRYWSAG